MHPASKRNLIRLALAPALAATLVFAACGDGDSEEDRPTVAVGGTLSATNTPAATSTSAASPSAAASASASASASTTGSPAASTTPGTVTLTVATTGAGATLVDGQGRTLYTWDNDTTANQSACSGGCATTWPPLLTTATTPPANVTGATGAFTLVTRADGGTQIAYKGKPLYRFAADTAPGQTSGDGVGGTWHIAAP